MDNHARTLGVLILLSASAWSAGAATTLENLQTAFNGESNAHAKYLAYAEKASGDGYAKAAELFRAAARAEEIHAKNHAEVIQKMGGTPVAEVKLPAIGATAENLQDAVKGETYERDVMYVGFLEQAKAERNKDAVRTLNFARKAEAQHAELYAAALGDLQAWKTAGTGFYVCPTCGETSLTPDFKKCPVCFTKVKKFIRIV